MPNNWYQIFGRNPWLWPLPILGESGKPEGNGITWPMRQKSITDVRSTVSLEVEV
jgi:palmitoyltransferase